MKNISFIEKYYLAPWLINIALVLVYLFGVTGSPLYTSVLNVTIKADPFDGTIMPFNMVPDYRVMTDRTLTFTEIDSNKFIDIPKYDPKVFGKNLDSLKPGSSEYKATQIAQLIYTTPYMGNYMGDHKEYAGSHLAVDIKAPIGTPVKSIANGVVVLSEYQASGYGNVVVIRHENINYNGEVVDLYSGYAHMSERDVKAGDKVSRGDIIGLVGNTGGTSTGSHLHFQIDVADAPYHLYWPFTSTDTRDAGVSFYGGIDAGIGKEKAMKYTINPIKFVYQYENDNISSSDNISVVVDKPEEEEIISSIDPVDKVDNKKNDEEEVKNNENKEEEKEKEPKKEIEKENKSTINDVNIDENLVSSIGDDFSLSYSSGGLNIDSYDTVSLIDEDEEKLDFNSAPEKPEEQENSEEEDKDEQNTDTNNNTEKEDNNQTQKEDKKEDEEVKNTDNQNNNTENTKFTDVKSSNKYYSAIEYFRKKGLISGYSDGTFKPDNNITRIENLKMLSVGLGLGTADRDDTEYFKDVLASSWQLKYVNKFVALRILSLDNPLFNPNNNITRVEGLKLLIKSKVVNTAAFAEMKVDVDDVKTTDWYYPYVVYAIKNDLLDYGNDKFEPNKPLTRAEVVNMMYSLR